MDLPLIFAALAAFGVAVYVLADGFDLGVGILFLFAPGDSDRDLMMASIEPVWDGNETWLVFGGTLLFAAFPAAYYILLPAFYLPIILMLFALLFRGIAFAFRGKAQGSRKIWDLAFAGGSVVAAFAQGLVLGGFINGIAVRDGMFSGGPLDFLSLLGLLCGLGLVGGYALMGAGWLIWKVDGPTQTFARNVGHAALVVTAVMMVLVSVWTAYSDPQVSARWFSWPNILWLAPAPLLTAVALAAAWFALDGRRDARVFVLSIATFLSGFFGLAVSLWPYIVPRHITVWDGASDPQSLGFAAVGLIVILPIVLAYQFQAYWIFRGKTKPELEDNERDRSPHIWARRTSNHWP